MKVQNHKKPMVFSNIIEFVRVYFVSCVSVFVVKTNEFDQFDAPAGCGHFDAPAGCGPLCSGLAMAAPGHPAP